MKVAVNTAEGVKFTLFHEGAFCPCCGMALRTTPTARKDKERRREVLRRIT